MIDLALLNGSKLLWGITLVIMNMGSRYVIGDLTKVHESVLMSDLFKKIVLFCMFFIGSRDILISLFLTFAFSIVFNGIFNEKSKYSLIPSSLIDYTNQRANSVSKSDYDKAQEIIKSYEGQSLVKEEQQPPKGSLQKYKELFE